MDVLAVMEAAGARIGSAEPLVIGAAQRRLCREIADARVRVADVINGLCVAVKALERSDPDNDLLPNMRAALIRAGATP